MFTLFVIPGDNRLLPDRAIESFGNLVSRSFILPHREIPFHKVRTEYFGFLYADEYIETRLRCSLVSYFRNPIWTALTLAKMVVVKGEMKFYQSPRIFKRGVILKEDLTPKENCWHIRVIDGFIRENARV